MFNVKKNSKRKMNFTKTQHNKLYAINVNSKCTLNLSKFKKEETRSGFNDYIT